MELFQSSDTKISGMSAPSSYAAQMHVAGTLSNNPEFCSPGLAAFARDCARADRDMGAGFSR